MEESCDKAPELPVETENVRRNSNSVSDMKPVQPTDTSTESTARKISIVTSRTTGDLQFEIKNESNMKRVDSDSKFGVMETISLDISLQDAVPSDSAESTTEICENPLMQNRPLNLDDKAEFEIHEATTPPIATQPSPDEPHSLSKYFSLPVEKATGDPESVQFFDALAEISQGAKSVQSESEPPEIAENANEVNVENCAKELVHSENASPGSLEEKETPSQPTLLKFFAEDKSGKDRDGKAFFDKIAAVNTPEDSKILELNQPILTETSDSGQFLISPVLNGEIEEAWIPTEKVRQILVSVVTSGSYIPDKNHLTFPEIIVDDKMDDPVKALLVECNSPLVQQRKVLTASDVTEDENGLQKLIEAECYHAAINLTKKLIKAIEQSTGDDCPPSKHTPLSLRLWYSRLAILIKLKKFSLAEVESAAFGDFEKPDLYYEFYPDIYKGKRGTMVPFSFRLLLAELPQYQGNHQVALDNMYNILHVIQKIIKNVQSGCAEDGSMIELSENRKNASLEIWRKREQRVLYAILNCVLSQRDYILAVSILNILLEKSKENSPQLLSALGRIYLQLGDANYAQECFSKAATISCEKSQQLHVEENINKALLAIAHNNCEEAYKHYQQAYTLSPNNAMLANNMAVCLLYMGRLKESLALLEKTIQKNPSACLHDGILFNICTLYELESSRCSQKKLSMLELVSKYAGDSFNVSCLKIQPVK